MHILQCVRIASVCVQKDTRLVACQGGGTWVSAACEGGGAPTCERNIPNHIIGNPITQVVIFCTQICMCTRWRK